MSSTSSFCIAKLFFFDEEKGSTVVSLCRRCIGHLILNMWAPYDVGKVPFMCDPFVSTHMHWFSLVATLAAVIPYDSQG